MVASAPSSAAPYASGRYARREPENTVLHRLVREHLEKFLRTMHEERGKFRLRRSAAAFMEL